MHNTFENVRNFQEKMGWVFCAIQGRDAQTLLSTFVFRIPLILFRFARSFALDVDVQIMDHNGVNKTIQNIYTKK